ncbi:MAG: GMC oxidoreductase [Alphaproteobacteria bacterium]
MQRYAFAVWRRLPSWLAPLCDLLRPRKLWLRWYAEMEPRAENRITLSDKKDAFGLPLPLVSYSLGERDKKTLIALHAQVTEEVRRLGLGRLEVSPEEVITAVGDDASHHLGSTRMGRDPASSVVDADCRVHIVENLYVAGGSVFPSGGSANPTYTIVALAIRLAEHLRANWLCRTW